MKHQQKRKHLETRRSPKLARMSRDPSKGHICTFVFIPQFENSQEVSPEPEEHVVVRDNNQTPGEESSDSEYVSCVPTPGELRAADEDEFENSQEDSPQLEAHVVVPDHSWTPGGQSSNSEYVSCVSSAGKLRAAAEDEQPRPTGLKISNEGVRHSPAV